MMVLLHNSILWKQAPEKLSGMIGCTESNAVPYKQICDKCLCSNYIQMLWRQHPTTHKMGNLQHTITITFLCWCDASSWRIVWCTLRHGLQKSPKKQALPFISWALCIGHTMHRNFMYIYSSQKVWCTVFWQDLSLGSSLSACHFRMVISNDWKRKLSRQAVMHKSRNWTECCNCRPVYPLQVFGVLQPAKMCNLRPKSVICGEHPSSIIQCIQSH